MIIHKAIIHKAFQKCKTSIVMICAPKASAIFIPSKAFNPKPASIIHPINIGDNADAKTTTGMNSALISPI